VAERPQAGAHGYLGNFADYPFWGRVGWTYAMSGAFSQQAWCFGQ